MKKFILLPFLGVFLSLVILANAYPATASSAPLPLAVPAKEVALTFDDGPYGTSTQQVLDILEQEHVHATFFLVGKNVEKYPALAKEIVADGNMIGNHTYDHPKDLTKMSLSRMRKELSGAEAAIASTTGVHATLFRPPYGNLTKKLRARIQKEGYTIVMWNVDPTDWDYTHSSSTVIEQNVLHHLMPHIILLLHDGRDIHVGYPRDNMVTALPLIIKDLKQHGYTFVSADKLAH